jgi:hypothetical protein
MFTASGAQGSWKRALRATRLGRPVLLGVLALGLCGLSSATRSGGDQIVLTGYGTSGSGTPSASTSTGAAPQTQTNGSFRIAGNVGGLYPGLSSPLVLTVTNAQPFTIVVTSIITTVNAASASCAAANLSVSTFSGQLSVPASGSAKTTVVASLAQGAPDACIGASFPLAYSGAGRKP